MSSIRLVIVAEELIHQLENVICYDKVASMSKTWRNNKDDGKETSGNVSKKYKNINTKVRDCLQDLCET